MRWEGEGVEGRSARRRAISQLARKNDRAGFSTSRVTTGRAAATGAVRRRAVCTKRVVLAVSVPARGRCNRRPVSKTALASIIRLSRRRRPKQSSRDRQNKQSTPPPRFLHRSVCPTVIKSCLRHRHNSRFGWPRTRAIFCAFVSALRSYGEIF